MTMPTKRRSRAQVLLPRRRRPYYPSLVVIVVIVVVTLVAVLVLSACPAGCEIANDDDDQQPARVVRQHPDDDDDFDHERQLVVGSLLVDAVDDDIPDVAEVVDGGYLVVVDDDDDDDPSAEERTSEYEGRRRATSSTMSNRSSAFDAVAPSSRKGGGPAFLRSGGEGRRRRKKKKDANDDDDSKRWSGGGVFRKALDRAVGGGLPGAIAGIVQVLSMMWVRTVINYQYRYGSSFTEAFATLYGMGGIPRLYSGVSFALIQAPLSRFVSTAANDGVGELLKDLDWGPGREVIVASFVVGFFRMMLMPIDTCKTVLQIEHRRGLARLLSKVRAGKVHVLYSGALANAASSFIGHYPWFYSYNLLSRNASLARLVPWTTGRNALIGFVSSVVSDTVANFMRVIKTSKQALGSTMSSSTTYAETIGVILAADGWMGLLGRGLKTRILGNALQSILFTVIWRGLSERWKRKEEVAEKEVEEVAVTEAKGGNDSIAHAMSD